MLIVALLVVAAVAGLSAVYRASLGARAAASMGAASPIATVRPATGDPRIALRVTQHFGAVPMLDRRVTARAGSSVMALLSREITVTTSYGGGFVSTIGGLASGYSGARPVQADWFYYVDGLQAHVGAGDLKLRAGASVWWDFHRWDFATSVPAVVGQYPAPFVVAGRASRPTGVLFTSGFEPAARHIASTLRSIGASDAVAAPASAQALSHSGHAILVGRWADLVALDAVRDAAGQPGASGIFVRFGDRGAQALGELGGVAASLPGAGAVLATVKPDDPDAALWLVTGSDAADVRAAANLLAGGHGARLAGRFGALVRRDGAVVSLPMAGPR